MTAEQWVALLGAASPILVELIKRFWPDEEPEDPKSTEE